MKGTVWKPQYHTPKVYFLGTKEKYFIEEFTFFFQEKIFIALWGNYYDTDIPVIKFINMNSCITRTGMAMPIEEWNKTKERMGMKTIRGTPDLIVGDDRFFCRPHNGSMASYGIPLPVSAYENKGFRLMWNPIDEHFVEMG